MNEKATNVARTTFPIGSGIEIRKKSQKKIQNRNFSRIPVNSGRKAQPSPPPKSTFARFGPFKRQNLSTAPGKCVDHLRFAVDASAPLQNRPCTHIFLWKNMCTSQPQVKTESPPPKSILARFGPVKKQNLSTAPEKCVDHLRFAVDALAPLQN